MAASLQKVVLAGLCAMCVAYAPQAFAKDHGNGHGNGHGHGRGNNHNDEDDNDNDRGHGRSEHHGSHAYRFSSRDRISVEGFLEGHYGSHCPPGLAKKHNGCLPPGQAKKRYRVGYPLAGVEYEGIPEALLVQLDPVPYGYQYVMVDKDVLLISEASHKVIDAITLLSAVGH
jgi:Ni/Co efflux regulator RcnB